MEGGGSLTFTTDMLLVLSLLLFTVVMFVGEWIRADIVAPLVLVLLGILGLVPSDELFAGFSSNAVLAVIATMIMGAGLERTGVMAYAASFIIRLSGGIERRLTMLLSSISGAVSGFLQNPVDVALFLPVASRISARTGLPLAKLLLPIAGCIILGGTITMVGSSPLIVLNDLIVSANRNLPSGASALEPFPMFAVAPVGLLLLASGIAYFSFIAPRLMPERLRRQVTIPVRPETYFAQAYGIEGEVHEVVVTAESPLVGMAIIEAEALHGAPLILAIKVGSESRLAPPADQMIWVGTVLGVLGPREEVQQFAQNNVLALRPRLREFADFFNPTRAGIAEAVVPPGSRFIGKKPSELRLRKRLGLSILAISRGDQVINQEVRETTIRAGDCLVFHGFWRDLANAAESHDYVVVTDIPQQEQRPQKLWHALVLFTLAVGFALYSADQLPVMLFAGAVGMMLFGVLSVEEAYGAVNWKTVFMLASLIPLSYALETTGAAAWLVQETLRTIGDLPSLVVQLLIVMLTAFFAMVMSNVGATVLMVPLAINAALATGGNPAAYALLVGVAASNNFLTVTNPVIAMIMGPGAYRTSDFLRVNGPLSLIFIVVTVIAVNLFF
jgi:di/tricarboxylate transporter